MQAAPKEAALNIYLCWSHTREDTPLVKHLIGHLSSIGGLFPVAILSNDSILPGEERIASTTAAIKSADIGIVAISPSLLIDQFTRSYVIPALLQRNLQGDFRIIPIVLKPCLWGSYADLRQFQPLPRNGYLSQLQPHRRDEELRDVCQVIANHLEQKHSQSNMCRHNLLPPPPDVTYDPKWYVLRDPEERAALSYLRYCGRPVVLCSPELFGKTWLLKHILRTAQERDSQRVRVVSVNLGLFDKHSLQSLDNFLYELTMQILEQVGQDEGLIKAQWAHDRPLISLQRMMQKYILPTALERLILAIDSADAIIRCPFKDDFFGLLRAWSDGPPETPDALWNRLRLLLVISTKSTLLIEDQNRSPFNLTEPIHLEGFSPEQITELMQKHRITFAESDIDHLYKLVGGHPYLVRIFLFKTIEHDLSLSQLLRKSPRGEGICDGFLRRCIKHLNTPVAHDLFLQIASNSPNSFLIQDDEIASTLVTRGILVEDRPKEYKVRCSIYKRLANMLHGGQ